MGFCGKQLLTNMEIKQLFKQFIKRNNFLATFTEIKAEAGINHAFSDKGLAGKEVPLKKEQKIQIYDGLGELQVCITETRSELKEDISKNEPEGELEFQSLEGLQSLSEFHHSGGELKEGMQLFLERNRRTKLQTGVLKAWEIGSVKMDVTGYGKYSASTLTVEADGKQTTWPFSMAFIKRA